MIYRARTPRDAIANIIQATDLLTVRAWLAEHAFYATGTEIREIEYPSIYDFEFRALYYNQVFFGNWNKWYLGFELEGDAGYFIIDQNTLAKHWIALDKIAEPEPMIRKPFWDWMRIDV